MDPILFDAIREFHAQMARLQKSGIAVTPDDQEEFFRVKTGGKYGLDDAQKVIGSIDTSISGRNLGRSAAQGALFNWGDELLGLLPQSMGGGAGPKAEMRLREDLFKDQHPIADAVAGVAGSLPWMAVPVGEAAKVGSLANAAKTGAKAGALYGAASGLGAGDNLESRLIDAGIGGVAGTAVGAIAPAVSTGVRSALGPVSRGVRKVSDAIKRSGGAAAVRARLGQLQAAGRGDITTLSDLSRPLQSMGDFAANNSEPVHDRMSTLIEERSRGMADRLTGDVGSLLGDLPDAAGRREALEASRTSWASGPNGYAGLRDQGATFSLDDIAKHIDKPAVKSAWKAARLAGDIKPGDAIDASINDLVEGGEREVTFDDMQQFRRALADRASKAFRDGNGSLGNAYKDLQGTVDDAIKAVVPDFGPVNAEYSARLRLEEAIDKGLEAWNDTDTRAAMRALRTLPAPEQTQARYALASQLVNKLRTAQTNRDAAKEIIDASANMRAKLLAVFGDEKTFDEFMTRAGMERDLNRMKSATGGSATHRRDVAEGADPLEHSLAVLHGPLGVAHAVGKGVTKATTGRLSRRTAQSMGDLLLTQGQPLIEQLIKRIETNPSGYPLPGPFSSRFVPAATASLLDYQNR